MVLTVCSVEDQHEWWLGHHAPIAREIPGLRSHAVNLSARDENGQEPAIAGADCLGFADWEAAQAAYESAGWQAARGGHSAGGAKTIRTWIDRTAQIELVQ